MSEPRVVTPQEAQGYSDGSLTMVRPPFSALLYTVATEPERTRAAVESALYLWRCSACGWFTDDATTALWPDGDRTVAMVCPDCSVEGAFVDYDLKSAMRTEPERTRAAVVKALRQIADEVDIKVQDWIEQRADAIENGAPL